MFENHLQIALDNNIDHLTVFRVLKKKKKLHPYKVSLVVELLEDNFDGLIGFGEIVKKTEIQ